MFLCPFHPVLPLDGKKKLREEGLQRERAPDGGCQEFFKNSRAFAQTPLVNFRENGREQFEAEAAAAAPAGESGTRFRDCVGTCSASRLRAPYTRKTSNFTFFPSPVLFAHRARFREKPSSEEEKKGGRGGAAAAPFCRTEIAFYVILCEFGRFLVQACPPN